MIRESRREAGSKEKPRIDSGGANAIIVPSGRLGSWHLRVGQTLSSFCEILNCRGISYVVLLPVSAAWASKRVGLLVSDEDIPRIRDLITRISLGQQLAIYSTTDLPGFNFQQHWRHLNDATNMAVLPPYLAEAMLARARLGEHGFRVPATEDMLLWVIYRALYLVGDAHFAPSSCDEGSPSLVGPSTQIIRDLARSTAAGLSEPFELPNLERHLASYGWDAPYDVLRRLARWNSWAASKLREADAAHPAAEPGMAAFFVRHEVMARGIEGEVAQIIESSGFELLKVIDLDEEQSAASAGAARGGNWGPGAFPVSGGRPARIIIAFDVDPAPVTDEMRRKYPYLDNAHILEAKLRCREFIETRMPPNRRFNPLHSTDDSRDAWRILRMFAKVDERALHDILESRKAGFSTHFEVIQSLTRTGLRAKIEVIRYADGLAVKKTYRHNCLRFMEREALFMDTFAPQRPEILPVLERGPNYLITPFVAGRPMRQFLFGKGFPRLLTLGQVRKVGDLLRLIFSQGYDPVDLAPHNLLMDKSGRLTAIDFEFVHRADGPIQPERSACLAGIPEDFQGEWPPKALWCPRRAKCLDPWRLRWLGCTGLTLHSFLYDPPSLQRIKRIANYPTYIGMKAIQRYAGWLRERAKHSLRRRMPAVARIAANSLRLKALRSSKYVKIREQGQVLLAIACTI